MRGFTTPILTPAALRRTWCRPSAKVRYLIRAADLVALTDLVRRVRAIADGAALMTETQVTTQVVSAVSNLLGNTPLEKLMDDNFQRLGPPEFDEADRAFAEEIRATLSEADIAVGVRAVRDPAAIATCRCAISSFRWTRCRAAATAAPMSGMSAGWCRPCRRAGRPAPSGHRFTRGSLRRRARARWRTRAWCTSRRSWRGPRSMRSRSPEVIARREGGFGGEDVAGKAVCVSRCRRRCQPPIQADE